MVGDYPVGFAFLWRNTDFAGLACDFRFRGFWVAFVSDDLV